MMNNASGKIWQFDEGFWLSRLNASESGLSQAEALKRLAGVKKTMKARSPFMRNLHLFIRQFNNPLMLLLLGAVVLSAFLGDRSDLFITLAIVLSTGSLSFIQERNAGKVVEKLQHLLELSVRVIRDGAPIDLPSKEIVPGDILLLRAGDMIPADCRILDLLDLSVNEASLTGESFPVQKEKKELDEHTELLDRKNVLWQGTNIVSGNAKALVVYVGKDTVFNQITQQVNTDIESGFETGIRKFGYLLMRITLILASLILILNLFSDKPFIDAALFSLALAVGMAPELLPAITTIAMSSGAKRLLRKKVIVKKLSSIQNLGEITLLCTDKTGTITEGMIEIASMLNANGKEDNFVREIAYWNAFFESGYVNPIDKAILKLPVSVSHPPEKTDEVPYDFNRKRLSIAIRKDEQYMMISKGAFREMVSVCDKIRLDDGKVEQIDQFSNKLEESYSSYGQLGLRCLAIAYKNIDSRNISANDEQNLVFAGFILMQDPVKPGIKQTIRDLNDLGVSLKIISGDNKHVAQSIAVQIGLQHDMILTGTDIRNTDPNTLHTLVAGYQIFAEVEPQQKELLIRAFRKNSVVAYMGDGINDVGALHAADVGISVDNAVDVAKDAADFVLLEKDLSVISEGIREGRKTFANTLKYIYISTGSTFGNMCSVAVASLILPFLPMLPKQILLTNFLTDFPYLAIASDNVDDEQLEKAGKWDMKVIRNYMIIFGIHSSIFDIITFLALLFVIKARESTFQTGWFIESVLSEFFILFIIRTHRNFLTSRPARLMVILSLTGLALTLALPYLPFAESIGMTPLPLHYLALLLGIVLAYIITADLLKVWFFKKLVHENGRNHVTPPAE